MSVGFDAEVLVVGAGPAGSTAARTLAERGVNVIVVDRETFPRYKTCGGGIIGVTRSCVPSGMPIRDEIYRASFSLKGNQTRTRESSTPIMATVARDEFDDWLLREAIAEGAIFLPNTHIRSMKPKDDHVVLGLSNGKQLTARYLVDASGTSSKIARQLGVNLKTVDLGLELEVETDMMDDRWRNQIHLDWGALPGSYGWLFPKGSLLTVGVIGAKGRPTELRNYLKTLVRQLDLENAPVHKDTGHLTRCRSSQSPLSGQRVLLVGDAAGLLEPWTREGISFATRSGRIAGEVLSLAISRNTSETAAQQMYRERLEGSILPEIRAGFDALRAFERHPEVFHFLMTSTPMGWKYFNRITSGDTNLFKAMSHTPIKMGIGALNRF